MDVCNLSLGSTKRDFYAALHELADLAYYRGTILVTAANNTTAATGSSQPSASVCAVVRVSMAAPLVFRTEIIRVAARSVQA